MSLTNDIPTKLRVPAQLALDAKTVVTTLSQLQTLGTDNNLAYTYYKGMPVICAENLGLYRWRPVNEGETGGTLASNFIYPAGIVSEDGVVYSNIAYNFFKENYITSEELNIILEGYFDISLPSIDCSNLGIVGGPTPSNYNIESIYKDTVVLGDDKLFRFSGIGVPVNGALTISEYAFNDFETEGSVKIITFQPEIELGVTAQLNGTGGVSDPFSVETLNPQKTINAFPYELLSTDDQHTLFITNGPSNVEIRVPDTLSDNFTCVIIQEGVGTVTVTALGATVLNIPLGLTAVIKGQYHWAMLEKRGATTSHYLGGSLKTTP